MGDFTPDNKIIQTYVWHKGQCYFVSTIERDSSAMEGGRYNETIVWEFDCGKRGAIVMQDCCGRGNIKEHLRIVERIFTEGVVDE